MFFLTLRGVSFGSCQSVRNGRNGFTLVEILVVIAIILILAALIFPNCGMLINRAESVLCTGKLRNLWVTFSNHLDDGTGWPQLPSDIPIGSVAEQQWWLSSTSNSMGLTASDWNCRSIARSVQSGTNSTQQKYLLSYLPALFDSKPTTPRKWGRMPWFTEIANIHGNGNLSIRADGSVCPAQDH